MKNHPHAVTGTADLSSVPWAVPINRAFDFDGRVAWKSRTDARHSQNPADIDPQWAASIDAIRAQFDKVLSNLGVERFESVGQPFDPHLHEAISMDGGDEIVIEELQAGYKMGPAILRHAMVKVGPAK